MQLSTLTTALDLLGLLAVVVGLALAAALLWAPAGLLVLGAGLLGISALIDARAKRAAAVAALRRQGGIA